MGERIFRPGIRTSDRTASLIRSGGWMAQVFYDWLITLVDDFGRYDARPAILRAEIFPLLPDMVRESDVERCLAACEKAGLIRLYAIKSKPYLELLDFRQRLRAMKSKFPPPPDAASPPSSARECMTMPAETETETETDAEIGGVGKPNDIENAFVLRLFDEVNWLIASQINPNKRERLIGLMVANGEDVSREVLESAPSKCDKKSPDVWLAWSMTTLANRLADASIKPKRKPVAAIAKPRPSPQRQTAT